MNLKEIRTYNDSKNAAFEEFVCQLARRETNNNYKEFVRNGIPDGGVECYWKLENGDEHAWQAKYVFEIDNVLTQVQSSYDAALENHPKMSRFVVAIPCDLPDPRYKKQGKQVKSAREKWDSKARLWEKAAEKIGRNVTVELWTASDLLEKMQKPENEGMRYFWFHEKEFTFDWFQEKFKIAVADIGKEYCLDKNPDVPEFCNMVDRLNELLKSDGSQFNKPLLFCMDAGVGEHSWLADFCRKMLERKMQAIFFPGQYFTSTIDPRSQIVQLLDQELNYSCMLSVLNTIGELKGERILFAIDDLGAEKGGEIWPQFLNGMLTEFEKFPWIAFAASVQSKDEDRVLPKEYGERIVKISYAKSAEAADGHVKNAIVSAIDKEPVRGLFIINSATVADYKIAMDSPIIRTFLRISTDLKNILYAVCSDATIECEQKDSEQTLSDCLQREIHNGRQAVFLIGNGGIGKTTTIVKAAVELCDSKKEIYLFQLGKDNDSKLIDEVVRRIEQERKASGKKKYILFIDNPYANSDGLKSLLNEIQYDTNVQVVMAERLNRFELIAEEVLPDIYFGAAKIIVPVSQEKKICIAQFDAKQIMKFIISSKWKREVVLHMFRSIENVDMQEIESIVIGQSRMSIIEWYLRACIEYNKRVDEDNALASRCKVNLDWDEWGQLFRASHLQISEDESRELQELFQVIAALDIFKIKASIRLLSIKSKIEEMRLNHILQSALKPAGNEPAIYKDNEGSGYIALKHDMVSTLYFEVTKSKPQFILEKLVDMLGDDKETVIHFEKQVFKRKYIQNECKVPFEINIPKLYTLFAQKKQYYGFLEEVDRTYSFDVAKVWMRDADSDKNAISTMWEQLLQKYALKKSHIKRKVYMCCLDDCMRRSIPLPLMLMSEGGDTVALKYAIEQKDLEEIADLWKKILAELYKKNLEERLYLFEWRKVIFDYLLYDFRMPEEFFSILDYEAYQKVDALYTSIESYVRRNGLNRRKYYALGQELYKRIAEKQPADVPSRMHLANCYERCGEFRSAEETYNEILRQNPNHMRVINALGSLYSHWRKDMWKELKENKAEAERLEKGCENYLKRAIELAVDDVDKSKCYGALGWFLFRTKRKYRESYNAFHMALKYCEQAATHNQLAMLCSFFSKNNDCLSIDEAKVHFERAISLLSSNSLKQVSNYMPYANMLYCIGEYDRATNMYKEARRLGEEKAAKMIDKIWQERQELKQLSECSTGTITTLQEAYDLICKNEAACIDKQQKNEILSMLLNFQPKEENAYGEIKKALKIIFDLQKADDGKGYNIIIGRIIQQIERFAMQYDVNYKFAQKKFYSQCFFIARYVVE